MSIFNTILTTLSFIFIMRTMFEFGFAFEYTIGPDTKMGDSIDMTPFIQYLAQSRILLWLGLLVCVELIRPCLSLFIHEDTVTYEADKQGWAGMAENAGGKMPLGLQVIGAIMLLVLMFKWWILISPKQIAVSSTFSLMDWSFLILAPTLMNLAPFLPKVRKNDS